MLDALRRIQRGEITTSVCQAGVWYESIGSMEAASYEKSSGDRLATQIGIAIGYGYVAGDVKVDGGKVLYTQLALTARGRDFLLTMESSDSLTEKPRPTFGTKLFATSAFIAGFSLLLFLVITMTSDL